MKMEWGGIMEDIIMKIDHILIYALTKGAWDLLEDGALPIASKAGKELLALMEKEGLSVEGESYEDLLKGLDAIYKKIGLAEGVESLNGEDILKLKINKPYDIGIMKQLMAEGIKPYMSPVVLIEIAALKKIGVKAILKGMELDGDGVVITFKLIK